MKSILNSKIIFAFVVAVTILFLFGGRLANAQYQTKPNEAKSNEAKSNEAKSNEAKSNEGKAARGVTMSFRSPEAQPVHPLAKLKQADPSGLLTPDSPLPPIDGNASYSSRQNRQPSIVVTSWTQPALRHRKLYFEDSAVERSNEPRRFGNLASGVHFFQSLFRLPLRLAFGR
jgi:hypothetical protein